MPPAKKKWLKSVIVTGVLLAVAVIVAVLLLAKPDSKQSGKSENNPSVTGSKEFKMTTDGSAIKYAGNPVYDACGLVSFDTIRKNVNNYQTLLDMNGTDKKPTEPLTIEHNYIDRDIGAPLGKDGQPRPTGTSITRGGGAAADKDVNLFISNADSNCWYGQGSGLSIGSGKIFAKVFITQGPTPLSADFLAYLATLNKTASETGIDVYVEPKADSGNFLTAIITNTNNGVAVVVKGSTNELTKQATLDIADKLAIQPKAPVNLTYPMGWSGMPNPCILFTASDFQQATGKPASALAEDTMGLSEIGGRLMQRSCERSEVERLDNTPISKSNVTIRYADSVDNAKKYVDTLKNNQQDVFEIQQLKQKISVADDAYVKIVKNGNKTTGYEFDMRIGQAVVVLSIEPDSGLDTSADAFTGRMLPIATSVATKFRQQQQ